MAPPATRSVPLLGDLLAFRRDRLGFLTQVAREQGDVGRFRIGPYRVWQLAHPDLVQDVLVAHAQRFRKGPVLQRATLVLGEGLLTTEGDHHRRHRRLLNHAFHPDRVSGYASVMVDRAAATSDSWVEAASIDVHAQAVRMTLATAGATLLGTEVDADVGVVEQAIADLFSAYRLAFVTFGWRLQHLPVGPPRRLRRGRAALHHLVDRAVTERRASGEERGDLLSSLVLADPAARLSDAEIQDQAPILLQSVAGHVGYRLIVMGLRTGFVDTLAEHPQELTPEDLTDRLAAGCRVADRVEFHVSPLAETAVEPDATLVINHISMHECRDIDQVTRNVFEELEAGGWFMISDFPFPEEDDGLRTVPGRLMAAIRFIEAQSDDQLLPRRADDDLLTRHGFTDLGHTELAPVHALTWGRHPT